MNVPTPFLAFALLGALVACGGSHRSEVATTGTPSSEMVQSAYCGALPVERSFCQAVIVEAPKATLHLAAATTDAQREHGLMGVANVPRNEGMIFVYPDTYNATRNFWMKDTITPLDMVFVSNQGTVTTVAGNVPATKPGTPDSAVAQRSGTGRFVIELAAGGAAASGLKPGVRLTIPDIAAQ
jgi:uncharacterized membrane protein (UPF0127 family)